MKEVHNLTEIDFNCLRGKKIYKLGSSFISKLSLLYQSSSHNM